MLDGFLIAMLVIIACAVAAAVILVGRFVYEKRRFAHGKRVPTWFRL